MSVKEFAAIVAAGVILGGASAVVLKQLERPAPTAAALIGESRYEIVYFGVRTCGPCRRWRERTLPTFRSDPVYKRIRVTVLEKPSFSGMRPGAYGRHNWLFDDLSSKGKLRATPTFVVVKDRKVLRVGVGERGWRKAVTYVRARASKTKHA
ncbi:MAG: hypothetical protein AAFX08_07065 [Pseudomonadota bacterium]